MAAAGGLSAEEFMCLQRQIMALKEQNYDLEEGNRRARAGGAPPAARAAPMAAPMAAAAEWGQMLPGQFKVSASSFSALGVFGARKGADEGAALLAEVQPLRERLRKALDELSAAKRAAALAQQRAAAEATGAAAPSAEALRRALAEDPEAAALGDEALGAIGAAAVRLDEERRRAWAAERAAMDPRTQMAAIGRLEEDLEKLRSGVESQSAQIGRLMSQLASDMSTQPDCQQNLEERLRNTERHLAELSRRISDSDGIAGHSYELKCRLTQLQERREVRDQAIDACFARQEHLGELRARLQARLADAEAELRAARRAEEEERLAAARPAPAPAREVVPVEAEPPRPQVDAEAQVDFDPGSPGGEPLEALRSAVEALRAAKLESERRCAREVRELRVVIRAVGAGAEAEAPEAVAADSREGLLYKQKIQELEALQAGLERDVELLRSSEQLLQQDAREKGELLRNLMREAHASSAAPAAAAGVPMLSKLWRAGVKTASGAAALATGRKARRGADLAEMEHIAEEALLDNMRLRRDLRTIAEEFRKATADRADGSPASAGR